MTDTAILATGPYFEIIDKVLSRDPAYHAFRNGRLDQAGLNALVDAMADPLVAEGLPRSDLPFVKRFPANELALVEQMLTTLAADGLIPSSRLPAGLDQDVPRHLARYRHGPYRTYIYPEESLLLAALTMICQPDQVIFLGSYYGYWAHSALLAMAQYGGHAVLVDPDPQACVIARANAEAFGLSQHLTVVQEPGEQALARVRQPFDWVVIDAETPRDTPDPDRRGKAIYRPLLDACLPHLTQEAMLICHNILFTDWTGDPAFRSIIARNHAELDPFMQFVAQHFDFIELSTTEGVGIGRRKV
jgi:predicted O-methyltransferase YrrM